MNITPWIFAIVITVGVGAIAAQEGAGPDEPAVDVRQRAVPEGVCKPGYAAVWVDASTTECLKEL